MTREEFNAKADAIGAGIAGNQHHGYFQYHRTRLYETCAQFHLLERDLGNVLDLGPFYSYTPLMLRERAGAYCVVEGDETACEVLKPAYAANRVEAQWLDLFSLFGPERGATFRLPYEADYFQTVLCFETLEHFNFNPVPFVRELWRVTKPGGRLHFTVPNRASGEAIFALFTGRNQVQSIDAYFKMADAEVNGRRVFYGFHWREYTLRELSRLFSQAGFTIVEQGWQMNFQDEAGLSLLRRMARGVLKAMCWVRPSFGKNCYVVAEKPKA